MVGNKNIEDENGYASKSRYEEEDPSEVVFVEEATSEIQPDETCGCRVGASISPCGTLQRYATVKWALGLFCIGNMMQQTILNGLYPVTVSTLEKRFELRSTESGMIGSLSDFGRATGTMFIILFAKDLDKPRWIGGGIVMIGTGCLLFALPHFIAPEYTYILENIVNYCGNVTDPSCGQSSMRNYRYIFIVAALLMGFGCGPLYSCCLTFLDENVAKRNSAFYNSLYMALGGLGPAVGILLGGATLELYTYIMEKPSDIGSGDYQWMGAWWIGYLVCGVILMINAGPVLLLPKYLPGTGKFRENRNVEAQRSHLKKNHKDRRGICRAMSEVVLLLKNKPYVFMTLSLTMNTALIYGFNTFGAKYLESVFGLTPFHSALIYGVAAIFASFGSQLCAGFIIKKFNLDVQGMLKLSIFIGILSVLCSFGFLLYCPEISFAGGTVAYPNSDFSLSPFSTCNENCGCSTDRYQPVCSDGITYFSPCFAGCNEQINDTTYANCSCVPMINSSIHIGGEASSESCDLENCILIIPFTFFVFLCFFTSLFSLPATVQVTLRCVPFESRDVAIPLQAAVTRLAGVVPGRVLVGFVLDFACVAWSTECGEQGACKSYKREEVARYNTYLLVVQTFICVLFFVLVFMTYKPAGETVKKTDGKSENIASSSLQNGEVNPDDTNERLLKNAA